MNPSLRELGGRRASIYLTVVSGVWATCSGWADWVFLAKLIITLAFSVNIVLRPSQDSCQQAYLIIWDFKFVSDIDKAKSKLSFSHII